MHYFFVVYKRSGLKIEPTNPQLLQRCPIASEGSALSKNHGHEPDSSAYPNTWRNRVEADALDREFNRQRT
jgi:hypothetical protein